VKLLLSLLFTCCAFLLFAQVDDVESIDLSNFGAGKYVLEKTSNNASGNISVTEFSYLFIPYDDAKAEELQESKASKLSPNLGISYTPAGNDSNLNQQDLYNLIIYEYDMALIYSNKPSKSLYLTTIPDVATKYSDIATIVALNPGNYSFKQTTWTDENYCHKLVPIIASALKSRDYEIGPTPVAGFQCLTPYLKHALVKYQNENKLVAGQLTWETITGLIPDRSNKGVEFHLQRIKIIQMALIAKGYYVGPHGANNIMDADTRAALVEIQRKYCINACFLPQCIFVPLGLNYNGSSFNPSHNRIRFIKETLQMGKYNIGAEIENDSLGPKTRDALIEFLKDNGLPVSSPNSLIEPLFAYRNILNKKNYWGYFYIDEGFLSKLQNALATRGYNSGPRSAVVLGSDLRNAIVKFQSDHDLPEGKNMETLKALGFDH